MDPMHTTNKKEQEEP